MAARQKVRRLGEATLQQFSALDAYQFSRPEGFRCHQVQGLDRWELLTLPEVSPRAVERVRSRFRVPGARIWDS